VAWGFKNTSHQKVVGGSLRQVIPPFRSSAVPTREPSPGGISIIREYIGAPFNNVFLATGVV